jgi:hypothetical protein
MVMAMYLRNALEDFHVAHLSDAQMKELNKIIRQALYEVVTLVEDDKSDNYQLGLHWLVAQIPDYWEVPGDGRKIIEAQEGRAA